MREGRASRFTRVACSTAVAVAVTISPALAAHSGGFTPPPVPGNIEVPVGNRLFFAGHGVGTQNDICLPSGPGFTWTLFTPQATLFDHTGRQLTTHVFSPNPFGW